MVTIETMFQEEVLIFDGAVGGTELQIFKFRTRQGSTGVSCNATTTTTPTSSSKTYNAGASAEPSGTLNFLALSTRPAYLMVELV